MLASAPTNASLLLNLIRSDQMTAEQVRHLLEDNPEFADWYRRRMDAAQINPPHHHTRR